MFFMGRLQIAVLLAALFASHVSGSPPRKFVETKPNFVILFTDDVSFYHK